LNRYATKKYFFQLKHHDNTSLSNVQMKSGIFELVLDIITYANKEIVCSESPGGFVKGSRCKARKP